MQTRSLEDISVQEITDAATVNRATFYDHYNDKFTLFEAMIAGEFHQMLAERNVTFDGARPSALKAVVLAVCDYLSGAHANQKACERQSAFQPLFEAAITTSVRRVLLPGVQKRSTLSAELIAGTASWAIYGAVKEWFGSKNRPAAEKIAPQIVALVLPLIDRPKP